MGIFSKLLSRINNQTMELLEASISQLRVGIFATLSKTYIFDYGKQKADFLSVAILNHALLEEPGNVEAKHFLQDNATLIEEESHKVYENEIVAEAFSYLYSAQILLLAIYTRNPFTKRAQELSEQATHLSIYIPNTYDICGSNNAHECALGIMEYASKFIMDSK